MLFGPGSKSRFGTRLGRLSSKSNKLWNQAHLAVVNETMSGRANSQRLSPDIVFGSRPSLQILEGGRTFELSPESRMSFGSRRVDVAISYDSEQELFKVLLARDGVEIESRSGRRSGQVSLTLGFESIDGMKFRIPWSKIEKGLVWQKTIEMRESFFDALEERQRLSFILNSNAARMAAVLNSEES